MGRGGEEGELSELSAGSQSCSSLDLALWSGSSVHSPVILRPAPRPHVLPPSLVPPFPVESRTGASPTDASLPVRMEHKLDVAATPGTLLCVIARMLAATIAIVARHCAERVGDLSACCSLGSPETGPLL